MTDWKEVSLLPPEEQILIGQRELFNCANIIQSPAIRQFTRNFLKRVPEQFWEVPSSSSGKYHPPEDQGPGGLVRHEIKAVEVGIQAAQRHDCPNREKDQIVSAIILHDTYKNGIPWGKNTDYTHGIIAATQILATPNLNSTDKEAIASAVRYHMARWNYAINPYKENYTREEMELQLAERTRGCFSITRVERVVQEADYFASRSNMSFMPGLLTFDFRHDNPPNAGEKGGVK